MPDRPADEKPARTGTGRKARSVPDKKNASEDPRVRAAADLIRSGAKSREGERAEPRPAPHAAAPRTGKPPLAPLAAVALFLVALVGTLVYLNRKSGSTAPEERPSPVAENTMLPLEATGSEPRTPEPSASVVVPPKRSPAAPTPEPHAPWKLPAERAVEASRQGDVQAATAAFDEAQAAGIPESEVTRLKKRFDEDRAFDAKVADAEGLAQKGDFDGAIMAAEILEPQALDRPGRIKTLREKIETLKKAKDAAREAEPVLEKAEKALASGELGTAARYLEQAKEIAPTAPHALAFELKLTRAQKAPPGTIWVTVDEEKATGVYARKLRVANDEYKAWLTSLPAGKQRLGPWPSGDFPLEQAAKPVLGVKFDDAAAYARAHHERLPDAGEREAIRKALGLDDDEGEAGAQGLFTTGFRTVLDPDGVERPPSADAPEPPPVEPVRADPRVVERVKTRIVEWLTRRTSLKCSNCGGKSVVKCERCDGRKTERVYTDPNNRPPCLRCKGAGTLPCDKCDGGISKSLVESTKKKFGACGPAILQFTEKSIQIALEPDLRRATVTVDVKYATGDKDRASETSTWAVDPKGVWQAEHPK
jgi:hypothetical protein